MFLEKVKAEGLAHLSYFIGSKGDAAVVDPRRDCTIYLDIARENDMAITHILETHRNEDYVTGSRELQAMTGARILHGDPDRKYGERILDGQEIPLGNVTLRAMETPGHTPESMSYVVIDNNAGPEAVAVFTGDTLFVGEVGRTDLFGEELTDELSAKQYDSLFGRLLPLGDGTVILPAHGAGSACGNRIAGRELSTIGLERAQNHALKVKSKEEFIIMKGQEALEMPYYFKRMGEVNLKGQPLLGSLPQVPPMAPEMVWSEKGGHTIVDVRSPAAYAAGHIPGSISLPLDILPHYGGWVLPYDRPIMLMEEGPEQLDAAIRALLRIGHDDVRGRVLGSIEGWYKAALPSSSFSVVSARELVEREDADNLFYLDIRMDKEWEEGHVQGAHHIFVGHLERCIQEVPAGSKVAVLCSTGMRGSLASSILKMHGREPLNLLGGMSGWIEAGLPVVR